MLYVNPLTGAEIVTLQEMPKNHPTHSVRMRAHAILMSDEGYQVQEIAGVYNVCRQSVSTWIRAWNRAGLLGLRDKPRSGRPRTLSPAEEVEVMEWIEEEPRNIKQVLARIKDKFGIPISKDTLRRLCKKAGLVWKRVRKSLKSKRDPEEFEAVRKQIESLIEQELKGQIDLYFFDESGFTLVPYIPYAWPPIGEVIEVPSSHSKRLNVLGFLKKEGPFQSFVFEGSVNSSVVVACFDGFAKQIDPDKTTFVMVDNAPTHTSAEFKEKLEQWEDQGLIVKFLSSYSPELNLIEILWRKIKYEWMPFSAYESYAQLKEALFDILKNIGKDKEYVINFS
jgi:transposase